MATEVGCMGTPLSSPLRVTTGCRHWMVGLACSVREKVYTWWFTSNAPGKFQSERKLLCCLKRCSFQQPLKSSRGSVIFRFTGLLEVRYSKRCQQPGIPEAMQQAENSVIKWIPLDKDVKHSMAWKICSSWWNHYSIKERDHKDNIFLCFCLTSLACRYKKGPSKN